MLDGHKMTYHLDRVLEWQKDRPISPIYMAFSPSSLCNHACKFCVYHYKEFEPIFFSIERYRRLVKEWKSVGLRSVFFAGDGEPLLNKNCVEMLEKTGQEGLDVAINSNGRLLGSDANEVISKHLSWARFSVNAGTSETYSEVHRTSSRDFSKVLDNIYNLVAVKKREQSDLTVGIQCVLLEENVDEIETLALLCKEIGVDYLAVKPFIKHPDAAWNSDFVYDDETLERLSSLKYLETPEFKFQLRSNLFKKAPERKYKRCLSGPFMMEIDARGDVYSCGPHIGNKDHCYGNILNQSFQEFLESPRYKNKLKEIAENLDVSKCMPHCRPDSVNQFLWDISRPVKHKNFI